MGQKEKLIQRLKSKPKDLTNPMVSRSRSEIYSVSRRTISSKSVMSLRPLTCHIPVIPGLMAILALW